MKHIEEILTQARLIPILTIDDPSDARPIAKAMLDNGLKVLEITLRTAKALDCIQMIRRDFPEAIVGAGTILNTSQFEQAKAAGAQFGVSPGLLVELVQFAQKNNCPYLPGVATVSEIMLAQNLGIQILKFFPAALSGGVEFLTTMKSLFPKLKFCPTGGITRQNLPEYLALENVIAVGGSFLTPKSLQASRDWHSIAAIAREVVLSQLRAL